MTAAVLLILVGGAVLALSSIIDEPRPAVLLAGVGLVIVGTGAALLWRALEVPAVAGVLL